jgi:hypothetical protein
MKKIAFWMIMLGSLATSLAQHDELIGHWEYTSGGQTSTLQFVSQNELIFNNERSAYTLVHDAIRVNDEFGYYFDYQYVLNKDQLVLTFPDGYQYPFHKVKVNAQTSQNSTPAGNAAQALYGRLCSFSSSSGGGSSYSSTRSLYFNGQGRFSYSTESSYGGNGDGYYGNDPNAITGRYELAGKTITMYLDGGGTQLFEVYFIQNSGEITEIRQGDLYYGKGICD